ncbi:MAG TPA: phosphotransferase [Aeromicrobium sp.]|nr:phosphotransferase [Aeromicrobium sp.]
MEGSRHLPGQAGGVEHAGRTVRRPAGPWTPAVHEFLRFLCAEGLRGVPEVQGIDGEQEVLTHVTGRSVPIDKEVVLDNVLVEAVTWLRDFHDIAEGFRPSGARRWRSGEAELAEDDIVCHNDPGTYNWIIEGGHFVAMIDWDMAGPGRRIDDLAFLAWTGVPFDRPGDDDEILRRLDLVVDAYGEWGPLTVLQAVAARMDLACARIEAGQQRGDAAMINLGRAGEPQRTRDRLAAFNDRRERWESSL